MKIRKNRKNRLTAVFTACALLAAALLMAGCGASGGKSDQGTPAESESKAESETTESAAGGEASESADLDGMPRAVITVKDYGDIVVALDESAAPVTVENFIKLASEGFYDGLTFHRIMDGFMIQGGDPNGNGTGGSDETIVGEFSANGHDNPISHVKGVISMARAADPDSASSQFFITVADSDFLDGQYAAFGYVIEGMDVADQIAKDAQPIDGNGTIPPEAQPVIESIRIVEE